MDRLMLLENLFYFLVFVVAFYYFTKGRWRTSRPSAAEEMTLTGKSIEEMLKGYLEKPAPPPPPPPPAPQNFTVPQVPTINLPPPPAKVLRRTKTITQSQTISNIKKGLLYDIIWKRKYEK
ncbi:MAG: hypothetical protein IT273_01880 [Chitinophagales bacterium]|nr:hypothetical protein [Chitinophagales bacterium]